MENAVEKLGFFDFFNHIIVGMFTILGLFSITIQFGWDKSITALSFLMNTREVNALFFVLSIVTIIAVAYILGLLCHVIFSAYDNHRTINTLITNLFDQKDSCIIGQKRKGRYVELAKILFDKHNIEYPKGSSNDPGVNWDFELNIYFYTYCLYQVQIKGLDKKPEKFRDIEGLLESFIVSLLFLDVVLFITGYFRWTDIIIPDWAFVAEIFMLLGISNILYRHRIAVLKNRIRMTLSLYDAICNQEKKIPVSETNK